MGVGAGLWLVVGCGSGEGSSAETDATALVKPEPTFDTPAYCAKVCDRATTCGLERAEAIAKGGSSADRAALDRAASTRDAVQSACVDSCTARPPGRDAIAEVTRAQACLQQPDCEALQACLEKL